MKIGGLQKVTLVDYPGKVACTIFLSGCNFRCPFCYSKELVLKEEIDIHPSMSQEYLFSFLEGKKGLIDGCVLCGGEPTVNGDELIEFIRKVKKMGFMVKLDTNGSNPDIIKKLIKDNLLDYIAMDIKAPLNKYSEATGVKIDINKIKESIEFIKNCGIDYEFRTTVVPGIHYPEDIISLAEEIAPAKKYFLQNFRGGKGTIDPKFDNIKPYDDKVMEGIGKKISKHFQIFKIR